MKDGDRVAIAVNFTTWGGEVKASMAIGPRIDITYESQWGQHVYELNAQGQRYPTPRTDDDPDQLQQRPAWHPHAVTVRDGVWRLNPIWRLKRMTCGLPLSKSRRSHPYLGVPVCGGSAACPPE